MDKQMWSDMARGLMYKELVFSIIVLLIHGNLAKNDLYRLSLLCNVAVIVVVKVV